MALSKYSQERKILLMGHNSHQRDQELLNKLPAEFTKQQAAKCLGYTDAYAERILLELRASGMVTMKKVKGAGKSYIFIKNDDYQL